MAGDIFDDCMRVRKSQVEAREAAKEEGAR
jgi:hypothetical protein